MEETVTNIEREILYLIIFSLDNGELTVDVAQSIAKDFLGVLPISSNEDLYQKLATLSERYPTLRDVFLKYGAPIEDQIRQKQVAQVQQIMNQQYTQAFQDSVANNHSIPSDNFEQPSNQTTSVQSQPETQLSQNNDQPLQLSSTDRPQATLNSKEQTGLLNQTPINTSVLTEEETNGATKVLPQNQEIATAPQPVQLDMPQQVQNNQPDIPTQNLPSDLQSTGQTTPARPVLEHNFPQESMNYPGNPNPIENTNQNLRPSIQGGSV